MPRHYKKLQARITFDAVYANHRISYQGVILQLPRSSKYASIAHQRVEVLELRAGRVEVHDKQHLILRLSRTALEKMRGQR